MRQVTEYARSKEELMFAARQLEKYGVTPVWKDEVKKGVKTGNIALFRADMDNKKRSASRHEGLDDVV